MVEGIFLSTQNILQPMVWLKPVVLWDAPVEKAFSRHLLDHRWHRFVSAPCMCKTVCIGNTILLMGKLMVLLQSISHEYSFELLIVLLWMVTVPCLLIFVHHNGRNIRKFPRSGAPTRNFCFRQVCRHVWLPEGSCHTGLHALSAAAPSSGHIPVENTVQQTRLSSLTWSVWINSDRLP